MHLFVKVPVIADPSINLVAPKKKAWNFWPFSTNSDKKTYRFLLFSHSNWVWASFSNSMLISKVVSLVPNFGQKLIFPGQFSIAKLSFIVKKKTKKFSNFKKNFYHQNFFVFYTNSTRNLPTFLNKMELLVALTLIKFKSDAVSKMTSTEKI